MKTLLRLCAITLASAALAVHAADKLDETDTMYAKKAAIGGMTEVKAGELAVKNAQTQAIKDFGTLMVTDHGRADQKLAELAKSKGLELPAALPAKKQEMLDMLGKLNGEAFDKAYVQDMVAGHEKALAMFKEAAAKVSDPELKAYFQEGETMIAGHLEKIKAIAATMK